MCCIFVLELVFKNFWIWELLDVGLLIGNLIFFFGCIIIRLCKFDLFVWMLKFWWGWKLKIWWY